MVFLREHKWFLLSSIVFCALSLYFVWNENWFFYLTPLVLLAVYGTVFYTEITFLSLFFLTPISINIEEYTDSFGLFLPTEPILFGIMILILAMEMKNSFIPAFLKNSRLVLVILLYLSWIFITSITSSDPVVSMKFLLAKLWFIVPMICMGSVLFQNRRNIHLFLWLFSSGMVVAMVYTLFTHAMHDFGEKEGHWVMFPFFKDHTIYGAMVAFTLPLLIGMYFSKKHKPLIQIVLFGFISINFIALYFSYTRAAWLSVFVAVIVWAFIKLRIKFSYILGSVLLLGTLAYFSWTAIEQNLAKNKSEHTTEEFGKRLESVSNVTTDASNLERLNRWACALEMFDDRPFFGFGPGTYAFQYARFQQPENLTIISTNFGDGGNAHSEYLGPLAETGLIGLFTVLILIGSILYLGITLYIRWNKYADRETAVLILGMNLALVTYFFHGILNNYLDTDKASVPVWSICAIFITLNHQLTSGLASKKD